MCDFENPGFVLGAAFALVAVRSRSFSGLGKLIRHGHRPGLAMGMLLSQGSVNLVCCFRAEKGRS